MTVKIPPTVGIAMTTLEALAGKADPPAYFEDPDAAVDVLCQLLEENPVVVQCDPPTDNLREIRRREVDYIRSQVNALGLTTLSHSLRDPRTKRSIGVGTFKGTMAQLRESDDCGFWATVNSDGNLHLEEA